MTAKAFITGTGWPTKSTLWRAMVPMTLLPALNLIMIYPNDFWWHLRTGRMIVETGSIPTTDQFSFTRAGQPWTNQAWLMQAGYDLLHGAGGLPLIILVHALTITAGYSLLLWILARHYGLRESVLATMIGALVGMNNWTLRPQGISFLMFGVLLYLIENHQALTTGTRARESVEDSIGSLNHRTDRGWQMADGGPQVEQIRRPPSAIWWVLPLFAVWVNSHGGFIFGLAVLGVYVLGRGWEFWRAGTPAEHRREMIHLAVIGLLALAVLALNPAGPAGLVRYVLEFVRSDVTTRHNEEFAPLVIRDWDGLLFFASLLLVGVVLVKSGLRLRADQCLAVLIFAGLSLFARRNLAWYGFVVAPILAAGLHRWRPPSEAIHPGLRWMNAFILGLLAVGGLATMPWWRHRLPLPPQRQPLVTRTTPTAAAKFLCDTLPDGARIYQYFAFASFQIWACPRLAVFIDPRVELYPSEQWRDYFAIDAGRFNWEQVADKYQLQYLFLSRQFQPLAIQAARASENWMEIYHDDRAVVFQKRASPP
jgi:hypothetical protein